MGGQREAVINQKSAATKPNLSGIQGSTGKIRFHENKGHVHFHDDNQKIKVEIPVAQWANIWQKLSTELGHFCFVDKNQNTILSVSLLKGSDGLISCSMSVESITLSDEYIELERFITGK